MVYIEGGYKTLSPIQLCNAIAAQDEALLGFRAVRTYFACIVALAAREAARRANGKTSQVKVRFTLEEIQKLTGTKNRNDVAKDVRALREAGLLEFSPERVVVTETAQSYAEELLRHVSPRRSWTRAIPIPRATLRFLARSKRPALLRVVVAYCLRGLSLEKGTGEVRSRGTVKASWVADYLGVSLRAAKEGRAWLVRRGFIERDVGSQQWKLNRHGAYFEASGNASVWIDSAPRDEESTGESAPPIRRPETPYGAKKNHEPLRSGFYGKADIRNVNPEDLSSVTRLEKLFGQAAERGIVERTEARVLDFVAAAERARSVRGGDPVRIFMGILRKRLWHHITCAEEERARVTLREYRSETPGAFRFEEKAGRGRAVRGQARTWLGPVRK